MLNREYKLAKIQFTYPDKQSEKIGYKNPEPALQVHNQNLHCNDSFAGFFKTGHDSAQAIYSFPSTKFAFNAVEGKFGAGSQGRPEIYFHVAAVIRNYRPLSENEIRALDTYFKIGITYSSNALAGNSLTLSETKVLLEDGINVGGKPIRDCYDEATRGRMILC